MIDMNASADLVIDATNAARKRFEDKVATIQSAGTREDVSDIALMDALHTTVCGRGGEAYWGRAYQTASVLMEEWGL